MTHVITYDSTANLGRGSDDCAIFFVFGHGYVRLIFHNSEIRKLEGRSIYQLNLV